MNSFWGEMITILLTQIYGFVVLSLKDKRLVERKRKCLHANKLSPKKVLRKHMVKPTQLQNHLLGPVIERCLFGFCKLIFSKDDKMVH